MSINMNRRIGGRVGSVGWYEYLSAGVPDPARRLMLDPTHTAIKRRITWSVRIHLFAKVNDQTRQR